MRFKLFFVLTLSLPVFAGDTEGDSDTDVDGDGMTPKIPVVVETPSVPAPSPTTVQQIGVSLEASVNQAEQMNDELAKIIALLREQKGLPPAEPFKSPAEIEAELKIQQAAPPSPPPPPELPPIPPPPIPALPEKPTPQP